MATTSTSLFDLKNLVETQLRALLRLLDQFFEKRASPTVCRKDDLQCIVDAFEQLVETKALPVSLEVDEGTDYEAEKNDFCEGRRGEITFWLRVSAWGQTQKSFWLLLMSIVSAFLQELIAFWLDLCSFVQAQEQTNSRLSFLALADVCCFQCAIWPCSLCEDLLYGPIEGLDQKALA